jgi:hypothetical protein
VRVTKEIQEADKAKGKPVKTGPDASALRAGPKPEREAELLAKWKTKDAPPTKPTKAKPAKKPAAKAAKP